MPESGRHAAERPTAERPTTEPQILSDTGALSKYRSNWSAGGELPEGYAKLLLFTQPVPNGLEVAVVESRKSPKPSKSELEEIWRKRKGGRASPVLVVAVPAGAIAMPLTLCGLEKQTSTICQTLPPEQVQILLANALAAPDHHSATNYLTSKLQQLQDIPGLRNQGLLATHELEHGVPKRPDWDTATQKAMEILQERDENLLTSLGFSIEPHDERINILTAGNRRTAVAVSLRRGEPFDLRPSQHSQFEISPVATAAQVAERNNLNWMILTRGPEIRLYSSKAEVGVGSGTREEKYLELDLEFLPEDQAGYLHLLFSADALSADGSLHETVSNSSQFATELAARLRDRVYDKTVPLLAEAVARQISGEPSERSLEDAYEQVMHILFRLLFVAYGEAKDLLPLHTNPQYQHNSLTEIAKLMLDARKNNLPPWDNTQTTLWPNVVQLWEAIDRGNDAWGVPAYNGGLFSTDPEVSPPGAAIARMRPLADEEFGPALEALLIDDSPDGVRGPVDFRSLSVREFGTIYEGLLESRFSAAPTDLTLNKKNLFVPAEQGDTVAVPEGGVYFHNRSGARKSSGSYFTKAFAVNHLIDHALVPALDNHTERLNALLKSDGPEAAAKAFFEFRCADIAMGSGHFLTAALDKIVEVLSKYMDEHQLPQITQELDSLRAASLKAVGDASPSENITYEALLRRQVARRCIYGVDKHAVAVELAQVALWIHTFIPGLPLSNLARNLVCGDSLTGVGSVDEVVQALEPDYSPDKPSLYRQQIEGHLNAAKDEWEKMAANPEATIEDVEESRQLSAEMAEKVRIATMQFDLVSASRAGVIDIEGFDEDTIKANHSRKEVKDALDWLRPAHFPALFPEVFWGDNPGFDCLLGNPPWEKVIVAKHSWWCLHAPGIRALPVGEMNREIDRMMIERPDLILIYEKEKALVKNYGEVLKNGFHDLGSGDTDLYKAFAWHFWQLTKIGGYFGVVLPRSALQGKGSKPWRNRILSSGTFRNVAVLLNNAGWVFDDVHHSYSLALCTIRKSIEETNVSWLNGPSKNLPSFESAEELKVPIEEFMNWSDSMTFPNIPSLEALELFRKFHSAARISAIKAHSKNGLPASPPPRLPASPPPPDQWQRCMRCRTRVISSSTCPRIRRYRRRSSILSHGNTKSLACLRRQVVQHLGT